MNENRNGFYNVANGELIRCLRIRILFAIVCVPDNYTRLIFDNYRKRFEFITKSYFDVVNSLAICSSINRHLFNYSDIDQYERMNFIYIQKLIVDALHWQQPSNYLLDRNAILIVCVMCAAILAY